MYSRIRFYEGNHADPQLMTLYLDDDIAWPLLARLLRNAGHEVQLPGDLTVD